MYTYRPIQLLHPICVHSCTLFTLFCRTFKENVVSRRLINVAVRSLFLFLLASLFLSLFFFQFSPYPLSSPQHARAVRFLPFRLSRGLFFLSSADVPAYTAGQRRINSQVLSDTIPRITASSLFLSWRRHGRSASAFSAPFRGDSSTGQGRRMAQGLFCARVSQFNDYPLESSQ